MKSRKVIWKALFALGLILMLARMEISRYLSDQTALLVAGGMLTLVSGAGVLLEQYHDKS